MDVAGVTDAEGRNIAAAALRSFRPGLIINRATGGSHVNVLYLRKILHQYIGGDLTLLGEIPDDPAVSQAIRKFLPVIEATPSSPAAQSLLAISGVLEQLAAAQVSHALEQAEQTEEIPITLLLSNPTSSKDPPTPLTDKSDVPPSAPEQRQPAGTNVIQDTRGLVA